MGRDRESEGRYARMQVLAAQMLVAAARADIDDVLEVGEEVGLLVDLLRTTKRANDELGGNP